MKQSDNKFESELARQYQQSKLNTKAPLALKQQVLLKAARADKENTTNYARHWSLQLAMAASILVLSFIVFMPHFPDSSRHEVAHNIIEFHSIDNTPSASEVTNIAYARLEQEYARNTLLIAAVQKQARLKINLDGSWQLNTCEQNNILLSKELVAMLDKYALLPELPESGMLVSVGFDEGGHIIQIEPKQSSMLC